LLPSLKDPHHKPNSEIRLLCRKGGKTDEQGKQPVVAQLVSAVLTAPHPSAWGNYLSLDTTRRLLAGSEFPFGDPSIIHVSLQGVSRIKPHRFPAWTLHSRNKPNY